MNILILNWRDPKHPLAGGAEISLVEHAKYWQKKGATITWFASSFSEAKEKETIENMQIIRKGSHYTVYLWALLYYLKGRLQGFDRVIDCFHFVPFFTPIYLKKQKIIALIHEVAKDVWFKNLPWIFAVIGSTIEPLFFKLYKHVPFITVSQSTREDLEKVGIPERNIFVIENGIMASQVKKHVRAKIPVLLFLGRISQDKGIFDAIAAYEIIYNMYPQTELWIAGKEQVPGTLKRMLKGKKGKIHYFGYISEEKKYELFQKAWVLVHPSTREGWGLTVIEANSMGLPVVGYDVPGLRDSIKHGKTGLLVSPTVLSLAVGLKKLLENEEMYNKFSENAKKWSHRFDWTKSTQKSWALLKAE